MWFARKPKAGFRTCGKVLLLIDWDNLFKCLETRFGLYNMRLEDRIRKVMDWVKNEVGEILGGYGWVFAPEHLNVIHQDLCERNKLRLTTCPKRKQPDANGSLDSVDEILIWFGKMMLGHSDVQFLCIVTGDKHYLPLMEAARDWGVKVAFAAPTGDSLSKQEDVLKRILKFTDRHPKSGEKMFIRLDRLDIQ